MMGIVALAVMDGKVCEGTGLGLIGATVGVELTVDVAVRVPLGFTVAVTVPLDFIVTVTVVATRGAAVPRDRSAVGGAA